MDKLLERLENKLDKQDERLDKVDIALTEIKGNLKEHMRRSLANEEANKLLKEQIDQEKLLIDARLSELEKVKDRLYFLVWFGIGILGVIEILSKLGLF